MFRVMQRLLEDDDFCAATEAACQECGPVAGGGAKSGAAPCALTLTRAGVDALMNSEVKGAAFMTQVRKVVELFSGLERVFQGCCNAEFELVVLPNLVLEVQFGLEDDAARAAAESSFKTAQIGSVCSAARAKCTL